MQRAGRLYRDAGYEAAGSGSRQWLVSRTWWRARGAWKAKRWMETGYVNVRCSACES
ncbi:hypothetical protein BDV95DRAFT_326788 [Massariosphaeria phaeospora]|uniref:Uncharacterized protein n=1 Tax=Massariosphaeria phaeospora TaxID=100035 RepID=A0A7C8MDD8_9PLEO|nr:hypothetical protein BDV95DRAFT_326788 [Massariosphaeria phaeospora]